MNGHRLKFGAHERSAGATPQGRTEAGLARLQVTLDGATHEAVLLARQEGGFLLQVGDRRLQAHAAVTEDAVWIHVEGMGTHRLVRVDPRARKARAHHAEGLDELAANMTSQVVAVPATAGARVRRGDVLVVLEAMKMETRITAPHDGAVTAVHCTPGQVVDAGVVLVEVQPDREA